MQKQVTRNWVMTGLIGLLVTLATSLWAKDNPEWNEAAFQVTGLHCQACADAVSTSLKKMDGVKSAKVTLKDKLAVVKYDAKKSSAQEVARVINATPSPMPDSAFQSALILQVDKVKGEEDAEAVQNALGKVKGVGKVEVDADTGKTLVSFDKEGSAHLRQLIDAVGTAGSQYKAKAWMPGMAGKSERGHEHGSTDSDESDEGHSDHGSHGGGHSGHHGCGGC